MRSDCDQHPTKMMLACREVWILSDALNLGSWKIIYIYSKELRQNGLGFVSIINRFMMAAYKISMLLSNNSLWMMDFVFYQLVTF